MWSRPQPTSSAVSTANCRHNAPYRCSNGPATITLLLDAGASVTLDGASLGRPLDQAVAHGAAAMVSLLLGAGADPNLEPQAHNAESLLCVAAAKGYTAVVQALVEAGANCHTTSGFQALRLAVASNSCSEPVALVKALLSGKKDPPTAADLLDAVELCLVQRPQKHQLAAQLLLHTTQSLQGSADGLVDFCASRLEDPAAARLALLHSWCADTAADDAGVEGLSAQQQDLAAQAAGVRELLLAVALDEKQSSSSLLA